MTPSSAAYEIRKTSLSVETIWHERGPRLATPLLVGTAIAVIRNPFAGRYQPDLMPFQASLRALGRELGAGLMERLGGSAMIEAYGKGIVVGEDGELEHGAVWHEAGGQGMREVLSQPKAIVPAAKTIGGPGTRLMVPLGHVHAAYVRSHFGTAEMTMWDAPRRDEIAFGLVMATGGRPHARIGGLSADAISVHDGQR
ncbi:amino acid synthesis family protein [Bradyrhizobium sp. AUGA SZCCT0222]|uniref:amino acid synthesis family protein n=1 Tax=Bradyrhizobium sp. AUGA SZCCT0222 TaxID=2807668 RepID=UPI001BAC3889|nr:amino acid synthesis family protein [Bradyrhizobium sp. AUGA SZCCT0222]MBR1270358.1 amino acid synthesis family protein [Bradyrhizobium sp. AUGA SZCCT0222]